jgi:hypothetical protein
MARPSSYVSGENVQVYFLRADQCDYFEVRVWVVLVLLHCFGAFCDIV